MLLDLMMPRFNGEEVLQFIRDNPRLATVPVIILSTNSIRDLAQEHVLEKADRRLIKSRCTSETLLEAIQYLLAGIDADRVEQPAGEMEDSYPSFFQTATA